MAVKIRLSRVGAKHIASYRIVAIDSKEKRDGAYLDNLGTYDATHSKLVKFHADRIDKWIAKGAVLSDTVKRLYRLYKRTGGIQKASDETRK
jgi:small subunit ribosomal protein S16